MKTLSRFKSLNFAPVLLRDVEDLASFAGKYKGTHGENLFSRSAVILAVVTLEHFIDLYFDRVSPDSAKARLHQEIKRKLKDRKIGTTVAAKWYVVTDFYTPNRFLPNIRPFSDLKELVRLRNRIVHLSQKQIQSRNREGVPNLLNQMNYKTAVWARDTVREMIASFYQMAYKQPPDWIEPPKRS